MTPVPKPRVARTFGAALVTAPAYAAGMPTATLRPYPQRPTSVRSLRASVVLAAAGILCQVAYPLTPGTARDALTVATVLLLFAAAATHASATRGTGWAGVLMGTVVVVAFAAEALGVATGFPFGSYAYADTLGPRLLGVPLVVPLAWAMLAYPCLLVGQRLAHGVAAVLIAAGGLASWDLFLDPQLVAAGHWHWDHPSPGLNAIPLTNTLGWLLVGTALMALLARLPRHTADDRVPSVVFLWTYASSVLANAAFFGRPGVALAGGIGMGLVALPYARSLLR